MTQTITFDNHAPINIADKATTVWSADWDFGHRLLLAYTTKRGHIIYWTSENSGRCYGNHDPVTHRSYCRDIAAIKAQFSHWEQMDCYHREVEADVDPDSIVDVDALAYSRSFVTDYVHGQDWHATEAEAQKRVLMDADDERRIQENPDCDPWMKDDLV